MKIQTNNSAQAKGPGSASLPCFILLYGHNVALSSKIRQIAVVSVVFAGVRRKTLKADC
jgi:hypothetical protein